MRVESHPVSPSDALARVAAAVPRSLHANITVIGSLAAGYQLVGKRPDYQVRTKDIDCVLTPQITAIEHGAEVAETLLAHGWRARTEGEHTRSKEAPGHEIKRSNKDLGRVLAIAYLTNVEALEEWADKWSEALGRCFPTKGSELAARAGSGLKALLASPGDLDEARVPAIPAYSPAQESMSRRWPRRADACSCSQSHQSIERRAGSCQSRSRGWRREMHMRRDGHAAAARRHRASRRDAGVPQGLHVCGRNDRAQASRLPLGTRGGNGSSSMMSQTLRAAERNAGVLAGWFGGVPPPRSRADRALREIVADSRTAASCS